MAVAAMFSPKETFVCYRQLLDYIAGALGRDIQLIQRKTYGEINELLGKGANRLAGKPVSTKAMTLRLGIHPDTDRRLCMDRIAACRP
jgi:hypothetical protein